MSHATLAAAARTLAALAVLACPAAIWAAPEAPASTVASQDACSAQMGKFTQALDFVRESQGAAAAARLKEQLLPGKMEAELLNRGGTCAVVGYLRSKRLTN